MDRLYWLIATGLVATYLATTQFLLPAATTTTSTATVTKVFDGDTVLLDNGETVRLAGIDTDEEDHPCYEPATRYLEQRVLGKQVVLEQTGKNRGVYDRLIRYILLDDTNINLEMVREGYAVARPGDDRVYSDEILQAQQAASANSRGCKWSGGGWTGTSSQEPEKGTTTGTDSTDNPDICQADSYINKTATFTGEIVDVHSTDSATYLNFGGRYPDQCFTGVVWSEDRGTFSIDLDELPGRTVSVSGYVTRYDGVPEITLRQQDQLTFTDS